MSARPPGQVRGRGADLALVVASTVVGLLLLEGVFRLLDLRGWHEARTRHWAEALVPRDQLPPGISMRFRPHSSFRIDYESNPRGYFDARNGLRFEMNGWGFRGPEFTREKAPGVRRVAVLGDSFTFGEGVKLEDTFCRRLEDRLRQAGGAPVEVLNLGTGGWGTRDEITYLKLEGLSFQPDLVIVAFVLNDADYAGNLDLWTRFRNSYDSRALRSSYLASWVYAVVARRTLARRYVEEVVGSALADTDAWQESFRLLAKGKALAEARGARFLVCIFPFLYELDAGYPFAPVHRHVRDYCRGQGIDVLDLFPAFAGQSDTALWVHPSDQHPNEKGHALAARAMADYVLARHLLEPARPGAAPAASPPGAQAP